MQPAFHHVDDVFFNALAVAAAAVRRADGESSRQDSCLRLSAVFRSSAPRYPQETDEVTLVDTPTGVIVGCSEPVGLKAPPDWLVWLQQMVGGLHTSAVMSEADVHKLAAVTA